MYTRSYGSRGGASTRLPPDYGGTALVIRQPEAETEGATEASAISVEAPPSMQSPRPAERSPRRRSTALGNRDTRARYPISTPEPSYNGPREFEIQPPFGNRAPDDAVNSDYGETADNGDISESGAPLEVSAEVSGAEAEHKSVLGSIFAPENLKSDDLLLLGLMFLLFGEGGGSKEALLILAVLYLSGL